MVVWTEERWRSHTPPRLERRRAAHRRRQGRGHRPGCWALHTPRRLERRGAAHQLAGRVQTNNPVWGGSLAVLGLAGKGRLASFSRHSHCMAGPPSEAERPLWRQLRHGMPQQRARRTPHSTERAAQSHRSDLVALELRGAKLPSLSREIHLRYCSAACRGEAPLLRYASVLDEIWCNRWTLARDTRHQLDCTRGCPRRLQAEWTDARGGGRTARVTAQADSQAEWPGCRGEQLAGTTNRD